MSKPYVYLDRYKRDGFAPAIQRNMPTDIGDHTRVAFHGIGDGTRSLEVYVQPNGYWSVETGPGPVSTGARSVELLVRGRLPIDGEPESVTYRIDPGQDRIPYMADAIEVGHAMASEPNTVAEIAARMRADLQRLQDASAEAPHGSAFMRRECFASIDTGLVYFEHKEAR